MCRSVKTVHTNLFAPYRKLHKLATTNGNFEKKTILLDMHHHKTYICISIFNKLGLKHKSYIIACSQVYSQKIASCTNLQLPVIIYFKSTLSDKHHLKTYIHVNFQQNRVSRYFKTVFTNLFPKNCKLHKFATTNSNFEKSIFLDMHHHTCISIFSKIRLKHKS